MYLTNARNYVYWRDLEESWNRKVQLGVSPPEVSYFYIQGAVRAVGDNELALENVAESWTCLVIGWKKKIIEKWIRNKSHNRRIELKHSK